MRYDLFVAASQNTNTTRSVPINGTSGLIWRVNMSSVSVPDAKPDDFDGNKSPFQDPHVVQTVYDLQYPGGGSLDDYINRTSARSVCVTVSAPPFHVNNFPPNVTDRYSKGDNGNC